MVRTIRGAWVAALLFSAVSCGADESASPAAGSGGGGGGGASASCELGTMYPGKDTIDPDAPVFEDSSWDQAKVSAAFAQAKADGSTAYLAYRAARDHQQYLECPFCACGCAPAIGHRSAIDCFKDMHGFT